MLKKRKQYNNEFKFRVALEACKGQKTLNELATIHGIHPNQISQWKRQFLEEGPTVFGQDKERQVKAQAAEQSELYEQIGRLQMELAWLKKKLPETVSGKRVLIEPGHPELSLRRQCELVGLNRSSWYYQPASESPLNLLLMRLLDEQYTRTPFYGWPRMTTYLQDCGYPVNHKRVQRLLRKMGLVAVYPKPRTTLNNPEHRVYPYRLRDLAVTQPNQVWCADITYIRLTGGFMYLVAIMDWFSRYILTWELFNTLDGHFCLSALREALRHEQPAIFNTDQGVQFTATAFTTAREQADVLISMDGRGRAMDNIFIERFWRSLKYEDIYLKEYADVPALFTGLTRYIQFYNHERRHQSLKKCTPAQVYFGR